MIILPLNTCQDSRYVICWTPSVLKNIQTKLACSINIWMEHLADELDSGWLVRIRFLEVHYKPKCAIFKRCICRSDYNSIPSFCISKIYAVVVCGVAIPGHNIVSDWRGGDSSRRIVLHSLQR
jgi:hypothetical protein